MSQNPLVSVIIRTYNSEEFLPDALKSVFAQTFPLPSFEVLLVDDGSKDGTLNIAKEYNERLRIFAQPHRGELPALNLGIQESKGAYIAILDADDTFDPLMLSCMSDAIKKNPKTAFFYSDYIEMDRKSGKETYVSLKENLFLTLAGNIVFKKDVLNDMGLFDEGLFFSEYDLLIKMISHGLRGIHIPKALYRYARNPKSMTLKKEDVRKGREELKKKYGDIPEIALIRDY